MSDTVLNLRKVQLQVDKGSRPLGVLLETKRNSMVAEKIGKAQRLAEKHRTGIAPCGACRFIG